jgi:hypothetical protein
MGGVSCFGAMMDVDISLMGYEQWVRFVFEHPVPEDAERAASWYDKIACAASQPATLVGHFTRMCGESVQIGQRYTVEQVDQGIWFLLSHPARFGRLLTDAGVPLERRLECIRAMYRVYAEYVTTIKSVVPNGFDMWWDLICSDFWANVQQRCRPINIAELDVGELMRQATEVLRRAEQVLSGEVVNSEDARQRALAEHGAKREALLPLLTEDERQILDALFNTLQRILELPNDVCQHCALHGLGHLHHPGVKGVVMQFLDGPGREWPPERQQWMRQCAACRIM